MYFVKVMVIRKVLKYTVFVLKKEFSRVWLGTARQILCVNERILENPVFCFVAQQEVDNMIWEFT